MTLSRMFLVLIFLCIIVINPLYAQQTLVLSTPANPPLHYPDQTGTLDLLMKEAFNRIGVSVVIKHFPPEKALANADKGVTDGDAVRIGGLSNIYLNLLQVPAIAFQTDFVAFTKDPKLKIDGWAELKPYNVAIIKGHKISEKMATETRSLTKAENLKALFNLLKNDKVDVAICERMFGSQMARALKISDIVVIDPPLAELNFFVYLHKKHELLIPGLTKALNEMHIDGTYKRIMAKGNKASKP